MTFIYLWIAVGPQKLPKATPPASHKVGRNKATPPSSHQGGPFILFLNRCSIIFDGISLTMMVYDLLCFGENSGFPVFSNKWLLCFVFNQCCFVFCSQHQQVTQDEPLRMSSFLENWIVLYLSSYFPKHPRDLRS